MGNELKNENREWVYDAFISYRHIQPDAFVAGSLHKILEAYKPPKSIFKGKNPEEIKRTKIKKVFRDEEELPLTSNLSDTIGYALENSEYLIAICSPRFGESLWCRKEVDTFIILHGKEKVLTVLVEGEPGDSFPEELLYKEVELTKPDGTTEIVKEPIEPLAANARGNSDKERVKLLKNESLRLMAPMFGVNFDDLKQRHREQKLRRTIRIVAAASAICLLFGIVSTTMAVKISNQNEQITQQNEQITQQNEQISLQADEIERQYEESIVSECTVTTELAAAQLEAGNRIVAVKTAYDVFEQDGTDNIYMQKTEKVLSDALELYDLGEVYNPDRIFKASSIISDVQISPNGEKIVVVDEGKNVTVWNSVTGEKLFSDYMGDKTFSLYDNTALFKNDSQFFGVIQDEFVLYDVDKREKVFGLDIGECIAMSYNAEKDLLLYASLKNLYLIDGTTGEILSEHDSIDTQSKGLFSFINTLTDISADGTEYYAYCHSSSDTDKKYNVIEVRKLDTHEIVNTYETYGYDVNKMIISGESLYISENCADEGYYRSLDDSLLSERICRYDILNDSKKPIWSYCEQGLSNEDFTVSGTEDVVASISYDQLEFISNTTGELVKRFYIGDSCAYLRNYSDMNWVTFITRSGLCINTSPESQEIYNASFFTPICSNIRMANMRGGHITVVPFNSSEVTVYRVAPVRDRETLMDFPARISKVRKGENGSQLEVYTYDNDVCEYDMNSNTIVNTHEAPKEKADKDREKELKSYLENLGISAQIVTKVFVDNDAKFYFVVYRDHCFDVYRLDDNGKPIAGEYERFVNYELYDIRGAEISSDGKMMWIDGTTEGVILSAYDKTLDEVIPAESMIVANIENLKYVDFDNKYLYCNNAEQLVRFPLYEKDEIAKIAKEEIEEKMK